MGFVLLLFILCFKYYIIFKGTQGHESQHVRISETSMKGLKWDIWGTESHGGLDFFSLTLFFSSLKDASLASSSSLCSLQRGPHDRAGIEAVDTRGSFIESGASKLALLAFQHILILTLLPACYQYAGK